MSSDDDTSSIEKDKKTEDRAKTIPTPSSGLRQRFRLLKSKSSPREGTISKKSLASLYNINNDNIEQAIPDDNEIENAVDALEDSNLNQVIDNKVVKGVEEQFDNIKIGEDNVVNIKEVSGNEVKPFYWNTRRPKTVYAPVGFVDFREARINFKRNAFLPCFIMSTLVISYILVYSYSNFLAGLLIGMGITFASFYLKSMLDTPMILSSSNFSYQDIVEVPAVNEFQPLTKHEGWVNEFPDVYNPHTYHISQTQSVYLKLQGSLLRVSHTRSKIPKRALWNESKIKPTLTHHRVYNLLGATVDLLPIGLAKKRHWSKKYPICITLSKDQMDFESASENLPKVEDEEITPTVKPKRSAFSFNKKKKYSILSQRFSKLTEENEEYEMESENSRPSTPSPDDSEGVRLVDDDTQQILDEALQDSLSKEEDQEDFVEEDFDTLPEEWDALTPLDDDSSTQTKLYIFGRTDREKEDWFRRFKNATHKGINLQSTDSAVDLSATLIDSVITELDYAKCMSIFNKIGNQDSSSDIPSMEIQWLNAVIGRILFDCFRDDNITQLVKDKIQRKLSSIKLPYFIEELVVTELSLGKTTPLIHRASRPTFDGRGLWIDLDINYTGLVVLILQTKLNLMKLKQPHANENKNNDRLAMFHSDVEDSAESTSDEEGMSELPQNSSALDSSGFPVQGLGGTTNTSKKFMKMVDKIAESKIFQAATEYRYIKKAMEGVSNTDLRLRVEVRELVGTLVLNVPPPPSDRVWIGFRPIPDLALSAQPIVGTRNITFLRTTSWIEKKLLQEFQKLLVIPNMEDLIVPGMSSDLPH